MTTQSAVLFDVDGTLVDSNYLHVHAWRRAFAELRIEVESWRIHRAIGMDGSALVRLLSDQSPTKRPTMSAGGSKTCTPATTSRRRSC